MKIDWKALAQSPGYRSLKAAYTRDVHKAGQETHPMRKKAEFLKLFTWVIARAQHYAIRQNRPIEEVLNEWEAKRDYWWLNFYGEGRQPKLPSGKPRNVKYQKPETYLRSRWGRRNEPGVYFKSLRNDRQRAARLAREKAGKKARWSMDHKRKMARIKEYQNGTK